MNDNIENEEHDTDLTQSHVLRFRSTMNTDTSGPVRPIQSTGSGVLRQRSSKLSKYGVSFQPPEDDAVHYASDAKDLSFFEKGRDFEGTYTNHKYTKEEKETLRTYESQDYLPSHSEVFKNWIKRQPSRTDWDQWVMMGLIGFVVGFLGFLLHQTIEWLTDVRIEKTTEYLADNQLLVAWGWLLGFSLLFLVLGSALVVFIRPTAGGSGLPELICFLNGTQVRHIFNVKTLVIKFLSCCLSVGSGMPVGPEGPMIHLGSLVGAGVSQFKSDTLKVKFPFFERFRNSEDRRNFVSAGAAAGVSAAFGAPVGGLLFSMEEVSSFWNERLSWQIFFCCMVSVFTSSLGNSAFKGFDFTGSFGLFRSTQYILFKVYHSFDFHIAVFVPTILIGALGGLFGSLFTFVNLKIARLRKSILSAIRSTYIQKFCRLAEPITILVIYITISVFLPAAFSCTEFQCAVKSNYSNGDFNWCERHPYKSGYDWLADPNGTEYYNCPKGVTNTTANDSLIHTTKTYNELATLLMTNGERAIRHLFSRETHYEFSFGPLATVLAIYFICACWSAGTAIASGLVVPMLLIGAIYGRMVGLAMVYMFGVNRGDSLWAWIDPGAMALIGSASFFGGVSRLTMSLTVIMMELTNDIQFLLPIMVAIMVAKWVGDFFTHPFYHALLELKCIPFLSAEPVVYNEKKRRLNLELYTAGHIMCTNVIMLDDKENVRKIANMLLETTHSGFPVLSKSSTGLKVFAGTISRLELTVLLKHKASFIEPGDNAANLTADVTAVDYDQLTIDKLEDPLATEDMLNDFASLPEYADTKVYLKPYINQSAMSVKSNFSLHRTYIIFRSLGLRHLTITSVDGGQVVGMITRRDLMGFSLEEKLDKAPQSVQRFAAVAKTLTVFAARPRPAPPAQPRAGHGQNAATNPERSGATSHSVILETPESHIELQEANAAAAQDVHATLSVDVNRPHESDIHAKRRSTTPRVKVVTPSEHAISMNKNRNNTDAPLIDVDPSSSSAPSQSDVDPLC